MNAILILIALVMIVKSVVVAVVVRRIEMNDNEEKATSSGILEFRYPFGLDIKPEDIVRAIEALHP